MKNLIKACLIAVLFTGFIVGCASPTGDLTTPAVVSVSPADAATGAPLNTLVTATFNKPMTAATINTATFTLTDPSAVVVSGTVTLNDPGTVAIFSPTGIFASNTVYTATITTGAQDMLANPLAADYVWSFTTGTKSAVSPATRKSGNRGRFRHSGEVGGLDYGDNGGDGKYRGQSSGAKLPDRVFGNTRRHPMYSRRRAS